MLSTRRKALLVVVAAIIAAGSGWLWIRATSLSAIIRGGSGRMSLVLLHGYGSRAEEWLQFEPVLRVPNNGRLIFLQGPLRGPLSGSRGWWQLDIAGHIPHGSRLADFSRANPSGLKLASRLVSKYLDSIDGAIVLGGFSQGAMVSAEIAFQTDRELAALVLLGGTTVNEAAWVERFPTRRQLPIFVAHGRSDSVLPFAIAERFVTKLKEAGLTVVWLPFEGGHEIPAEVVSALNDFLATLPAH